MFAVRLSLVIALLCTLGPAARAQFILPDASQSKQKTDAPADVVILAVKQACRGLEQSCPDRLAVEAGYWQLVSGGRGEPWMRNLSVMRDFHSGSGTDRWSLYLSRPVGRRSWLKWLRISHAESVWFGPTIESSE
jgi:hypothetical protein